MPDKVAEAPTLYDILGVPGKVSAAALRRAWCDRVRENREGLGHEATAEQRDRLQEINEAYFILRDPFRRREYDRRTFGRTAATVEHYDFRAKPFSRVWLDMFGPHPESGKTDNLSFLQRLLHGA